MKVSVVTPSFNPGRFLERTIASVLDQRGDFDLEYIVVDGGSTDGTLETLRRHEGRLRFVSERDRGQSDAINKGFRLATGDVLAWLGADDTYAPGGIQAAVRALGGTARWCFGRCAIIDDSDREVRGAVAAYKDWHARRYSLRRLVGCNFIAQPAVFFRRDLFEQAGPLDESLHYAMDYDLWLRFARLGQPVFVPQVLASFRWHAGSKTGARYRVSARECLGIAWRRARGAERVALAAHAANYAAQLAVYGVLDRVGARAEARQ